MSYRFDTLAIHAGQPNDERTGAVTVPVYQTSTFQQLEPGVSRGFDYSRTAHPTRHALEQNLAALEGARYGLAFSSGMAAIHCVLSTLRSGDHVVATQDLYGGAWRIFTKYFAKFGVEFTFVDTTDPFAIEKAIQPTTHFGHIVSVALGNRKTRLRRARPLLKEMDSIRFGERAQTPHNLALRPERLATGDDDAQVGTGLQQAVSRGGGRRHKMLAIIQKQQQRTPRKVVRQCLQHRTVGLLADFQSYGHCLHDVSRVCASDAQVSTRCSQLSRSSSSERPVR